MPRAKKTDAPAATAAKKTTSRKPAAKVELFIEHNGIQASANDIAKRVKADYAAREGAADIKTLNIYVKPEDNAAYYVVNGDIEGKMEL